MKNFVPRPRGTRVISIYASHQLTAGASLSAAGGGSAHR